MTIIRVKHDRRYTIVDNVAIDDGRISFRALGLLVYLLSKPDDWRVSIEHLASQHIEGREAVRTAFHELLDLGYAQRHRTNGEDGSLVWEHVVYERPAHTIAQETVDGSATDGSTVDGFPAATKDCELRTEIPRTENQPSNVDPSVDGLPEKLAQSEHLDAARSLADLLADRIAARGSKRPTVTAAWVGDMEKLIRIDGHSADEIHKVIVWLDRGADKVSSFWQPNVRSPATLRKQWDRMAEQYRALGRRSTRSVQDTFQRIYDDIGGMTG